MIQLLLSSLLVGTAAWAAPDDPTQHDAEVPTITADLGDPLPVDPRVRSGTLDNGLTWYVEPNARPAKRAELRLALKVGSILERDEERGLAHFTEHMLFNGTEAFPDSQLIAFFERAGMRFGSHLNAYTSFDQTVYVLQVPTDDAEAFETGFEVMREWLTAVTFDREECERERGVVLEEWRLQQGLRDRVQKRLLPLQFHDSRYLDRVPIGTEESLTTFDCATAESFWERWYRPDLAAVMAVGDFDPDQVEGWIEQWFGDLKVPRSKKKAPKRRVYTVPDHDETLVEVMTDPEATQSLLQVSVKVDAVEGQDHAAYRRFLLEQLVFMMANERVAIAGQDPAASFLGAQVAPGSLGIGRAAHTLQIVPKSGREREALVDVMSEIEGITRFGFTEGELERGRRQLALSIGNYFDERDKTDNVTHVEELLRVYLEGEAMPGIPYEYGLAQTYLPDISVDEANAWAMDGWMPDVSRSVFVLQPASAPALDEATVRSALVEVENAVLVAPEAEADLPPLMEELPEPGTATKVSEDAKLGTSTWTLSNGATLVLKPTTFQEDQVLLTGFSPGGTVQVSDDDHIAAVTASSLRAGSGAGPHDAVQLGKILAGTDIAVDAGIGRLRENLGAASSVDDLEAMFQLLHLVVTQPRFDEDVFARAVEARRQGLSNRDASPDAMFEDAWTRLLWDDHPRYAPWTEEDVDAMDLERSEAIWIDRFADLSEATFVMVGNLDEATVIPLVERYLATLPSTGRDEGLGDDGAREAMGSISRRFDRGDIPRTRVRLRFHGPFDPTPVNRVLLEGVVAVLQTDLHETLREALGGTYGVRVDAGSRYHPEGSYWLQIDFECDPDRADELIAAMWAVVEQVKVDPFPAAGMKAVRAKNRRDHETAVEDNVFWMRALVAKLSRGEDPRDILTFEERNQALKPEAVRKLAVEVLDVEDTILAVAAPTE